MNQSPKTILFLDFDRVLYDTQQLLKLAMEHCDQKFLISPESYQKVYSQWSTFVRNPDNLKSLSEEEQQTLVSWIDGFVPELAKATCPAGTDLEKYTESLRLTHREIIEKPLVYEGAMELLTQLPKDDVYIFTAGGEKDQWAKLIASGVPQHLGVGHIRIVSAKTMEAFTDALDGWGIRPQDTIIHVNDRPYEFAALHEAHENTRSVWATWPYESEPPFPDEMTSGEIVPARDIRTCCAIISGIRFGIEGAGPQSADSESLGRA